MRSFSWRHDTPAASIESETQILRWSASPMVPKERELHVSEGARAFQASEFRLSLPEGRRLAPRRLSCLRDGLTTRLAARNVFPPLRRPWETAAIHHWECHRNRVRVEFS